MHSKSSICRDNANSRSIFAALVVAVLPLLLMPTLVRGKEVKEIPGRARWGQWHGWQPTKRKKERTERAAAETSGAAEKSGASESGQNQAGLISVATTTFAQLQKKSHENAKNATNSHKKVTVSHRPINRTATRLARGAKNSTKKDAGHASERHRTPDQSAYAKRMRELTKLAMERQKLSKNIGSESIAEGVHSAESQASNMRSQRSLLSARIGRSDPQFENPSFESGSDTTTSKTARTIPGWKKYGRAIQFVRKGAQVYSNQAASSGNYLMAFLSKSAGLWQAVEGHTIGNYYRLVFNTGHRQGYSCPADDPCTMEIFVMDRPKQWTDSPTTTVDTEEGITWYEIAYIASAEKMYFAFVYGGPYDYGRAVFLDDVGIRVVEPWSMGSNNPYVLLQTVSCTDKSNPTEDTCSISDYVSAGMFDGDGVTDALFTGVGSNKAVWAVNQLCTLASDGSQTCSGKYKLKSKSLNMPSAIENSTGNSWFLDSGYDECSVKNQFALQTAMFQINVNSMGFFTLSDEGVKCGFMFLMQEWKQNEATFAR